MPFCTIIFIQGAQIPQSERFFLWAICYTKITMQELEIEKRYLIPEARLEDIKAKITSGLGVYINDVYVPNGEQHKTLRLRQKGDQYMATRKAPIKDGDTTTMLESTLPLSKEEFDALAHGISTNVEKTRYQVDYDGWRGELDIFSGRHTGLAVLEFEFPNESELRRFIETTSWDLPDITQLEWLASGRLAETSLADLSDQIASLLR